MNIKAIALPAVLVGAAVAFLLAVTQYSIQISAHAEPKAQAQAKPNTTNNKSTAQSATSYQYVAQPGDSYSRIARKAVQTYGKENKVNLSSSRIMYAETHLTLQAGSPLLNQGQTVTITKAQVKGWVDKAKALSATDAAKWDKYTVGVNFNTDKVGQVR